MLTDAGAIRILSLVKIPYVVSYSCTLEKLLNSRYSQMIKHGGDAKEIDATGENILSMDYPPPGIIH